MMALVEAARKVRAITARTCTHGQIGSQCGRRERLWPSSVEHVLVTLAGCNCVGVLFSMLLSAATFGMLLSAATFVVRFSRPEMALDTCAAARSRTELSRGGIEYELSFWDKWMASRGGKWASDFLQRLDPSSPFRFQKELATTRAPNQTHFTVLDVGSGPLPKCGRELTRTKLFAARSTLEVIAVDPLAKDYDRLLRLHALVPPTRARYAHGERLREHFNDNFFDAVYALNSLDHSREPMHVLQQMLAVVRCGRFVIVGMTANEGVHMGYEGFHQWNFANLRGRLTLHARNTTDVDVLTALGSAAVRSIRCNHKSRRRLAGTSLARCCATFKRAPAAPAAPPMPSPCPVSWRFFWLSIHSARPPKTLDQPSRRKAHLNTAGSAPSLATAAASQLRVDPPSAATSQAPSSRVVV